MNRKDHPILFTSLQQTEEANGVKQVMVVHPPRFRRVVRSDAEKGIKKTSGRPKKGTAWADLNKNGKVGLCSCGRRFQGNRGKLEHCRFKPRRGSACQVIKIKKNRSECFFCGTDIEPSTNFHKIEEHTFRCPPLTELKNLIPRAHLEDDGLQLEEIRAFNWPAAPL